MPNQYVELHCHSALSLLDGASLPESLAERAAELGYPALAITDHDTMAGVDEAVATGRAIGVRVIPGIELSIKVPHGSMHLLGYFHEPAPEPLPGPTGMPLSFAHWMNSITIRK